MCIYIVVLNLYIYIYIYIFIYILFFDRCSAWLGVVSAVFDTQRSHQSLADWWLAGLSPSRRLSQKSLSTGNLRPSVRPPERKQRARARERRKDIYRKTH